MAQTDRNGCARTNVVARILVKLSDTRSRLNYISYRELVGRLATRDSNFAAMEVYRGERREGGWVFFVGDQRAVKITCR